MVAYELNVGARVTSADGHNLGKIEQLIVHPDTETVEGFLLDPGAFSTPKIVDASLIESTSAGGVVLTIPSSEAEHLPSLVHEQHQRVAGNWVFPAGMGGMAAVAGSGAEWVVRGTSHGALGGTGASPFYLQAPIGAVETKTVSNLSEDVVLVSEGTDVLGSDGRRIGTIDEVFVDENRCITGIRVKAGWVFRYDIEIPAESVATITHEAITLNVTAETATKASRSPSIGRVNR